MGNLGYFDAANTPVVSGDDFEPVPPGIYVIGVKDSGVKANKNGTGTYLGCTFEIMEGPHKGRLVWENFTLEHPSEKAVQIGRGKLSGLCKAAGKPGIRDSSELHGVPVKAKLDVEPASGEYKAKNVIKSFVVEPAGQVKTPKAARAAAPAKPAEVALRTDGVMTPEVAFDDDEIPF